jgi:hypothetical protein
MVRRGHLKFSHYSGLRAYLFNDKTPKAVAYKYDGPIRTRLDGVQ